MAKRRRRIKQGMERVYLGGRIIRVVAQVEASRLLSEGKAVEIQKNGVYMGVELMSHGKIASVKRSALEETKANTYRVLNDPDARRSCVVLSRAETEAVAHRLPSRTEGMTEHQRDARVGRGLPEMDLAEAARRKFREMFPGMATA
jgi:hypothetical protein